MKEGDTFSALSIVGLHKLSRSGVLKVSEGCFSLEINPSGFVNVNFFFNDSGEDISLKALLSILMFETFGPIFSIFIIV